MKIKNRIFDKFHSVGDIMKKLFCAFILFYLCVSGIHNAEAQVRIPAEKNGGKAGHMLPATVVNGDTMPHIRIRPIMIFPNKADTRRYERLIRNIKVAYPIAKYANKRLQEIEEQLKVMPKKDHDKYIKQVEKELKKEYAPILREMTFSQGKILIKLIDRETGNSSYQLVKELRGGFSAFLWQGVARLFGANLKDTYDKDGEDKVIEYLIGLYESGYL